jgi:hypothetical protein
VPDASSRLTTLLAIVLTSDAAGEITNAAHAAQKLLKAEGLSWHDVAQALEQRGKLLEAAKTLKTERDHLLAENERLKRLQQVNGNSGNAFAAQLWQPAGMPLSVDNRHAAWLLDLVAQGRFHLTPKESDFATSCASRRRLSDAMRDWLQDLVRKAIARTGEAPPP